MDFLSSGVKGLTMAIVSYCGSLSQSVVCWSPYMEIHFESVDPTDPTWQNVQFGSFSQTSGAVGCLFGDGRRTQTSCGF